jgi:hypothetical protein
MVKYLDLHNFSFALGYFFNVNGKAIVVTHHLLKMHQTRRKRRKQKERTNVQSQKNQKKNAQKQTQIQIPSLAPKPLTNCMKQIRQREGREGKARP